MIEDQRRAIDAKPCQRDRGMQRCMAIDVFKMVPTFITEISGNEESFRDGLLNFGKKVRYIFNSMDRNDLERVEEKKTPFVVALES